MVDESASVRTEEFRQFVVLEYSKLVRAVAMACASPSGAEDAVQEALARAWEKSQRGEVIGSLGRWTISVALNLVRKRARHLLVQRKAWPRLIARESAEERVGQAELIDLRNALRALPQRQREVTVLHYYLGYPIAEIAHVLGISEGTVKSALHRARASLAQRLGDDDASEDAEVEHVDQVG